jgi:hypothetical protein
MISRLTDMEQQSTSVQEECDNLRQLIVELRTEINGIQCGKI